MSWILSNYFSRLGSNKIQPTKTRTNLGLEPRISQLGLGPNLEFHSPGFTIHSIILHWNLKFVSPPNEAEGKQIQDSKRANFSRES